MFSFLNANPRHGCAAALASELVDHDAIAQLLLEFDGALSRFVEAWTTEAHYGVNVFPGRRQWKCCWAFPHSVNGVVFQPACFLTVNWMSILHLASGVSPIMNSTVPSGDVA